MAAPDLVSLLFCLPSHRDGEAEPPCHDVWPLLPDAHDSACSDTDQLLVTAIQRGDEAAFAQVFRAHYAPLRAFARRLLRSEGDAMDVVEDVFARWWAARQTVEVRTSIPAYLYSAVRHRAIDVLRQSRTRRTLLTRFGPESLAPQRPIVSPDSTIDTPAVTHIIHAAIATLPERRRLALTLRWEAGLSNQEIAAVLHVAPQSVANLIQRALADLRAALPDDLR